MTCHTDQDGNWVCYSTDSGLAAWIIAVIVVAVIAKIIFWVCICYCCCYKPRYVTVPVTTANVTVVSAQNTTRTVRQPVAVHPSQHAYPPIAQPVGLPSQGMPTAQPYPAGNTACNTVMPPPYNMQKMPPAVDEEDEDDGAGCTDRSALLP